MHLSGLATKWTRIHKPVALVKQINCMNSINPRIQEDMHVKQLMLEHGIDNVRGGSCTKCQLGPVEMKALRRELWYARNCCTRCGRDCHFVNNCNARKDVNGLHVSMDDEVEVETMDVISSDDSGNEALCTIRTNGGSFSSLTEEYCTLSDSILKSKHVEKRIKDCVRATKCLMLAVMATKCVEEEVVDAKEKDESPSRDGTFAVYPKPSSSSTAPIRAMKKKGQIPNAGSMDGGTTENSSSRSNSTSKSTPVSESTASKPRPPTQLNLPTPCARCNRNGHSRAQCDETRDCFGFDLSDIIF